MSDHTTTQLLDHAMQRISIHTGIPFSTFRERYERAVPQFDQQRILDLAAADATWDDVLEALRHNAPHDFVIFSSVDAGPLMRLAGHRREAVEYLMGNHTIAERMFRYDPHTLLYAPLRVLLFEDEAGAAVFALDRPSTAFGSLGRSEIDEVGVQLDRKVAALLEAIGVAAPKTLMASTPADASARSRIIA
ncbi:DUF302 domain-containing protein [Curtobacterium sp. 22159]|uniref:DUF302 domain-containing protein n=1 Tax=Curtobacterium sp. 22159 TaxID=3453882 RepID=UPI003F854035